MTNKSMLV